MQADNKGNERQREEWLDYSKGIGIVFVVFAHCITRLGLSDGSIGFIWISIYTMYMPLFFILAGFVLNDNKKVFSFIIEKLKRLMGSYLLFAVLTTAIDLCIDFLLKRTNTIEEITSGIYDIIVMSTKSRYCHLWFFPVMFWGIIITFIIVKYIHDNYLIFLISIIMLIVNQFLVKNQVESVFGLRESLYAQFFIIIGYLLKKNIVLLKKNSNYFLCSVFLIIWLYGSYEWMESGHLTVDYWDSHIFPLSWTFCLALFGTAVIVILAITREQHISSSYRIIERLGKYSINIYGIHQVFLVVFSGVLSRIKDIPIFVKLPIYFFAVMLFSIFASAVIEISKKIIKIN